MRSKNIIPIIEKVTDGVIGTVTDYVLLNLYFILSTTGRHTYYEMDQAMREAQRQLDDVNYKTIKSAIYRLIKSQHIQHISKKSTLEISITAEGKKRISELIPKYRKYRPWDGFMYLVSYDIPNQSNYKRDLLRSYLKRIGCALLQESLWVTPYNPTQIVSEFTEENHIKGMILVSKLGSDGSIGNETRAELIYRIYNYSKLQKCYQKFIEQVQSHKNVKNINLFWEYLSILRDDPQLPFELEPKGFLGKKANILYNSLK